MSSIIAGNPLTTYPIFNLKGSILLRGIQHESEYLSTILLICQCATSLSGAKVRSVSFYTGFPCTCVFVLYCYITFFLNSKFHLKFRPTVDTITSQSEGDFLHFQNLTDEYWPRLPRSVPSQSRQILLHVTSFRLAELTKHSSTST